MSYESTPGSNSHSESSTSSSSQAILILQSDPQDITDLTLNGMPAPLLTRTGTVKRVSSLSRNEIEPGFSADDAADITMKERNNNMKEQRERCRKSLDCTYRHSLESIYEYKPKNNFSYMSRFPSLDCSSIESSSSGGTDNLMNSGISKPVKEDKGNTLSPSSSYLSWIESINSEHFSNTTTSVTDIADNKIGEWNNFWLNYNSARGKYLSSPYLSVSNGDKTVDELSDEKSSSSTQKEFNEKNSEAVILTVEEANEVLKYCQKITDILQNALRKNDQELRDDSRNDSYYSQPASQNSFKEDIAVAQRERSFSYTVDSNDLQKHRQPILKPDPQSSSSSCINALLNTGVADILKRVMNRRRDIMGTDNPPTMHRSSFSDWTTTK